MGYEGLKWPTEVQFAKGRHAASRQLVGSPGRPLPQSGHRR